MGLVFIKMIGKNALKTVAGIGWWQILLFLALTGYEVFETVQEYKKDKAHEKFNYKSLTRDSPENEEN